MADDECSGLLRHLRYQYRFPDHRPVPDWANCWHLWSEFQVDVDFDVVQRPDGFWLEVYSEACELWMLLNVV